MKKLLLAVTLSALFGCTTGSPTQFYRPIGQDQQVEISGNFNQLSFEHKVFINQETVITGSVPYDYEPVTFTGQYGELKVSSDCSWKGKTKLTCLVSIDGEKAATLTF